MRPHENRTTARSKTKRSKANDRWAMRIYFTTATNHEIILIGSSQARGFHFLDLQKSIVYCKKRREERNSELIRLTTRVRISFESFSCSFAALAWLSVYSIKRPIPQRVQFSSLSFACHSVRSSQLFHWPFVSLIQSIIHSFFLSRSRQFLSFVIVRTKQKKPNPFHWFSFQFWWVLFSFSGECSPFVSCRCLGRNKIGFDLLEVLREGQKHWLNRLQLNMHNIQFRCGLFWLVIWFLIFRT